jgi:hypothetical protein
MKWRIKLSVFCVLAIPAFTGFPVNHIEGTLLPGAGLGWVAYGLLVHAAIFGLLGKKSYRVAITIGLLISLPVVCLGAGISFAGLFLRGWDPARQETIIAHYISLAITMITVIPLALSMVAMIPIHRIENRLLQRSQGVSLMEKSALMVVRVFIHIIYFVIPDILEVLREERIFAEIAGRRISNSAEKTPFRIRVGALVRTLVQIGVEGICSAIRYVPLWAEEISRLPGRSALKKKPGVDDPPE